MAVLNLENTTILVVEDDDMSFLYLNQIFKLTKGKVLWAKNGKEAIKLVRDNQTIDLVLMDIQLPDIDGNTITREIRKTHKQLPIIAQTADKTLYSKDNALEAGCTDVLVKPYKMEELLELIKHYLQKE
jgi:DNA-binding response OmpR family regulator